MIDGACEGEWKEAKREEEEELREIDHEATECKNRREYYSVNCLGPRSGRSFRNLNGIIPCHHHEYERERERCKGRGQTPVTASSGTITTPTIPANTITTPPITIPPPTSPWKVFHSCPATSKRRRLQTTRNFRFLLVARLPTLTIIPVNSPILRPIQLSR